MRCHSHIKPVYGRPYFSCFMTDTPSSSPSRRCFPFLHRRVREWRDADSLCDSRRSYTAKVTRLTVDEGGSVVVPVRCSEYSLAELKVATGNFSSEHIVSESKEKALNVVYKRRLHSHNHNHNHNHDCWIIVKKFSNAAWSAIRSSSSRGPLASTRGKNGTRKVVLMMWKWLQGEVGRGLLGEKNAEVVAVVVPSGSWGERNFYYGTQKIRLTISCSTSAIFIGPPQICTGAIFFLFVPKRRKK